MVLNSHYHVLKHADLVVMVQGGRIVFQGTYQEIIANAEYSSFLQLNNEDKEQKEEQAHEQNKEEEQKEEQAHEQNKREEPKDMATTGTVIASNEIEVEAEAELETATVTKEKSTVLYAKEKRRVGE